VHIDPKYVNYYVYSAAYHYGKQTSCGACPVVWKDEIELQGSESKQKLTWADGNYHLYDARGLSDEDAHFVEESIYLALNETGETFGKIKLDDSDCEVRWCVLEEEQMRIVMDMPD